MDKLLWKLLGNGAIVVLFLMWFTEASFLGSLAAAVVLTLIAYVLGDRIILKNTNNMVATVSDAVLAAVYLYAVAVYAGWSLSFGELITIVAVLGLFEYFFHFYLMRDAAFTPDTEKIEPIE
ncbi:hypothetical protein J31TS4_22100 [Paenibacillus sp. J31TS4]|uniref:DUF2512 family protein n=1 Tax=Paenibacillus sp. J31TS4 TaxID=2807195 RepID=UPI001B1EDF34|nr:DUF2512 family protein [Paenibacillus sp. J31TS4]GIP38930.1 hypothetical protein J31TS4_22100 [Paenibacillus sp. J31TS4]